VHAWKKAQIVPQHLREHQFTMPVVLLWTHAAARIEGSNLLAAVGSMCTWRVSTHNHFEWQDVDSSALTSSSVEILRSQWLRVHVRSKGGRKLRTPAKESTA